LNFYSSLFVRRLKVFVATFALILLLTNAVLIIVLMAIQTDKAEQGGVMGIGGASGRQAGSIDVMVGPERILKPLTRWACIGFLFSSIFAAIPELTIIQFALLFFIYAVIMLVGNRIWTTLVGTRS
jgi:preprotein translocase subunit SecG